MMTSIILPILLMLIVILFLLPAIFWAILNFMDESPIKGWSKFKFVTLTLTISWGLMFVVVIGIVVLFI